MGKEKEPDKTPHRFPKERGVPGKREIPHRESFPPSPDKRPKIEPPEPWPRKG